jgi:hypothetical protein
MAVDPAAFGTRCRSRSSAWSTSVEARLRWIRIRESNSRRSTSWSGAGVAGVSGRVSYRPRPLGLLPVPEGLRIHCEQLVKMLQFGKALGSAPGA